VESHVAGRKNDGLMAQKVGSSYPQFVVLDPKGGVLSKQAGVLSMDHLQKITDTGMKRRTAFLDLKKKADAGEAGAKDRFAVMELDLGHVTYAEFRKRYPDLKKLNEDLRDAVLWAGGDDAFARANKIFAAAGRDPAKVQDAYRKAAEIFLVAAREGAEPMADRSRRGFYFVLGKVGLDTNHLEMLELCAKGLADDAEDNEKIADLVAKVMDKAKELKAKTAEGAGSDAGSDPDKGNDAK
jgi:hypothetical protein